MKSFILSINSLADLIEKENKFLEQGKSSLIGKSIDKKAELLIKLQNLEENIKLYVSANTVSQNAKIIERVRICFDRLQNLIGQNEILLQININVSEKIVEIYKEKRMDQTVRQFGYTKEGRISALKNLEKVMPAISLNNKV